MCVTIWGRGARAVFLRQALFAMSIAIRLRLAIFLDAYAQPVYNHSDDMRS